MGRDLTVGTLLAFDLCSPDEARVLAVWRARILRVDEAMIIVEFVDGALDGTLRALPIDQLEDHLTVFSRVG